MNTQRSAPHYGGGHYPINPMHQTLPPSHHYPLHLNPLAADNHGSMNHRTQETVNNHLYKNTHQVKEPPSSRDHYSSSDTSSLRRSPSSDDEGISPSRHQNNSDAECNKAKYPDYCQTITVRDSNGLVKELVFPKALDLDRPKRARTTFSAEQLYTLEREFQRNQYLVGRERTDLARKLQLSETQVKVWYQNRRTKFKRDKEREAEVSASKAESMAACNILKLLEPSQPASSGAEQRPDSNTNTISLGPPPRPPPQYLNPLSMPPIGLHLPHAYFPS